TAQNLVEVADADKEGAASGEVGTHAVQAKGRGLAILLPGPVDGERWDIVRSVGERGRKEDLAVQELGVRFRAKSGDKLQQPLRGGQTVIVGERQNLTGGLTNTDVVGARQACLVGVQVAQVGVLGLELSHDVAGAAIGTLVDDQQVERRVRVGQ